jgi:squalene-associated FAD-dependent desaturase
MRVDNGQHVFLRCCSAYIDLLARIGAADLVTLQPRLRIPVLAPGRRRAQLQRSGLPAPLHLAGSLLRYKLLSARDRVSVARAMRALAAIDVDDPAVDAQSFGDWLTAHGQTSQAVAAVWELITRPTINLVTAQASLAQAAQVFQVGLLSQASAADVGHARAPLSDVHDVAARRALAAAGVDVRLRAGATALTPTASGFLVSVSGAPAVDADAVVVALSPERAARLLPRAAGVHEESLRGLGRSPIVNVHVVYDRRVLDEPFAAAVGSPVQWVFDRTASGGVRRGQYLTVSLSAADAELPMTVEQLRARFLPALAELFAGSAGVDEFFVTREHAATFRATPGARALRPGPRTALPGLVLAGAWTDTGWPATMEGAVRSGHAAVGALFGTALEDVAPAVAADPPLVAGPTLTSAAPEPAEVRAGGAL